MSSPKIDLKQALDLFKWMNRGGIASLIPIGAVFAVMLVSKCGPVLHSTSWGDENLLGQVELQDHPEEMVAHDDHHGHDDHGDDHGGDEAHAEDDHAEDGH